MADYLALPNELQDLIVLSQRDLSCLSRTSKSMHQAVLPRLYKRISLNWNDTESPSMSSLLEVVLRSANIAAMVEELRFDTNTGDYLSSVSRSVQGHRPGQVKLSVTGDTARIRPMLQEAMCSLELSEQDLALALDQDTLDTMIATIIVSCPNLKVLHLHSLFLFQNTVLSKVLYHFVSRNPGGSAPALRKLERVYLSQEPSFWCKTERRLLEVQLSPYLSFFHLPSLRFFFASLPDRKESVDRACPSDWPTSRLTVCAIRKLILPASRAQPTTLAFIIKQTPHLRSLIYDHCTKERVDCMELRHALKFVSHTLTELVIAISSYGCRSRVGERSSWTEGAQGIGSLAFLSHLTKLEIALPILLNWRGDGGMKLKDVLPYTLEDFCIRDDFVDSDGNAFDEFQTVEEIQNWIGSKVWQRCTPNLKRVGLRLDQSVDLHWLKEPRNKIRNICEMEMLDFWFAKQEPDLEFDEVEGIWVGEWDPLRTRNS